jgi:PKD repeat protein
MDMELAYIPLIRNNGYGFYHYSSSNNVIYSNEISSNGNDAFYIWCSAGNEIYGNEISGSNKGFEIWIYSSGNSIYENNITNNNKGVYIYYPSYASNSNLFYHNNFILNAENNTWDECSNNWYNTSLEEGNYYDDYEGTDGNEDGIGDVPYNISGGTNQDLYLLMESYVEVENEPPVAYFTYSPENTVVNETIIFNASLSYDPDGNITAYEWEFGDGVNRTGEMVNHSYSSAGNYTVNLTVTDDDGATNSTSKIVEVVEKTIFDTGSPENPYPSIFGTHNGTIIPNLTITVSTLYTYPCSGTGGHTEYARIWNFKLGRHGSALERLQRRLA